MVQTFLYTVEVKKNKDIRLHTFYGSLEELTEDTNFVVFRYEDTNEKYHQEWIKYFIQSGMDSDDKKIINGNSIISTDNSLFNLIVKFDYKKQELISNDFYAKTIQNMNITKFSYEEQVLQVQFFYEMDMEIELKDMKLSVMKKYRNMTECLSNDLKKEEKKEWNKNYTPKFRMKGGK